VTNIALRLRPSEPVTVSWFGAIVVVRNIDRHERRLKSLIGGVILLEYIYNLEEELVQINIITVFLISADRHQ
jgi:hypothetical protein